MILCDANAASQLDSFVLGKGSDIIEPLEGVTGGRSLLTMRGEEWKRWRQLFNGGFSAGYMTGLAPSIADEVAIFRQKLLGRCSLGQSSVFQLEELTLRLAFDIIGSVVLTLPYCYYLLSQNPEILSHVIEKHHNGFGTDPSETQDTIHEEPQRLNEIPYTTAYIKEVLRIFPPAAALRRARPDLDIVDGNGCVHPTEGCNAFTLNLAVHRNPKHWKDPDTCIPERWLVGPEDPLYPPKGAWRPFEWGPRSCIGQTLAMTVLKIGLLMTVREFSITPAYDEWDQLHPRSGVKTSNGNRAYQAANGGGGARPADRLPVRVELRKQ
ncbi:P450 monooxygenase AflN 1 [Colletotrichum chlorophyti]|uniref:p450 monooxygenase AflN 1 n=1 Tax=Colletotrichum chlorophyti TaxID=708187 RepID=A0A1Q8S536_9PEZI|nr:P450 monooxygenase AflN 1 [Colletotrichum chlorophyti]